MPELSDTQKSFLRRWCRNEARRRLRENDGLITRGLAVMVEGATRGKPIEESFGVAIWTVVCGLCDVDPEALPNTEQ